MNKKINRVILIVADSLGVGSMPDAALYSDEGANTLRNTLEYAIKKYGKVSIPNLLQLGLLSIDGIKSDFVDNNIINNGCLKGIYGRLAERSNGKDSITGHWEIAGLVTDVAFKTYPDGFPDAFIYDFEKAINRKVLGNKTASGTLIIDELGSEHERTGYPIVYTSADSVFQIAANVNVIPLDRLYHICEVARKMLVGEFACARVIARPYIIDDSGKRVRTGDRRDYAVSPPEKTLLDYMADEGNTVYAIGKISDIFNGQGITKAVHTESNEDGMSKTYAAMHEDFAGIIFTNLVDFDTKFGHRRDPLGYADALFRFDSSLQNIISAMNDDDLLIITADHGNDPTFSGWDHTREYVPLLVYTKGIVPGNLHTRESFADIAATIRDLLCIDADISGESFADMLNVK